MKKTYYDSPLGRLVIKEKDDRIVSLDISEEEGIDEETPLLIKAKLQLDEYFQKKRTNFDLPLETEGTVFQKTVWNELRKIPYGKTTSYKNIASKIGNKNATRAVGGACGANPIMILIPCHRVIGANGNLTGFAGGLSIKEKLLDLEKQME